MQTIPRGVLSSGSLLTLRLDGFKFSNPHCLEKPQALIEKYLSREPTLNLARAVLNPLNAKGKGMRLAPGPISKLSP